ncbi:hypothetical protein NHQ30_011091 [Ciborinia camelliae]|nr:hypothetical protein NHQ30_011091 [Ciborinia camelliae]
MSSFKPVPKDEIPNPVDENSVAAINHRNRSILYASNNPNNPNPPFNPSVLNLINNMPNDEASEARLLARTPERRDSTAELLDGVADKLATSQGAGSVDEKNESVEPKPTEPSFFRCCQCGFKSKYPAGQGENGEVERLACQRENDKVSLVQGKEQSVLIVTACTHSKCSRCVNVDENNVRIGIKPWELKWTGPDSSTQE